MLHITLDPSTLSKLEPDSTQDADFTLSLTGVFWPDDVALPAEPRLTADHLYPWRWDLPTHVRLFWLDEYGAPLADSDVDIPLLPFDASYQADTAIIQAQVEALLTKEIFDGNEVRPEKILHTMAANSVTLDDATEPAAARGYLRAQIAELAQKTPPHNQGLKLVFLARAEDVVIPANAAKFVLFPVGAAWWRLEDGFLADEADHKGHQYTGPGDPVAGFKVYCGITKIAPAATGDNPNSPIRLIEDGAYYGQVNLALGGASDTEDWLPGLTHRAAVYFDLPARLLNYLESVESVLTQVPAGQETPYCDYIRRIERFLLTVTRDMLGTGKFPQGDGGSLLRMVAVSYAYARKKEDPEVDEVALMRKAANALEAHFSNDTTTPDNWRNVLRGQASSHEDTAGYADDFMAMTAPDPPLNAGQISDVLPRWRAAWETLLQDKGFANRVVTKQWNTEVTPGGLTADEWSGVKGVLQTLLAELPSVRQMQGDSLVARYRSRLLLLAKDGPANGILTEIASNLKECLLLYVANRRANAAPVQELLPTWSGDADPFANPPAGMTGAPTWVDFMAFMNDDPLWDSADEDLFPGKEKVYDIPPPIRVTVDRPGPEAQTPDEDQGDLNNEISGHLLFGRRGADRGAGPTGQQWRSFNRVKAECRTLNENEEGEDEVVGTVLEKPLLVPAFMPEVGSTRRCFLTLGNEKLSLIAGHRESLQSDAGEREDEDELGPGLWYDFDRERDDDDELLYVARALWYGYHYQFAGFVALNSGVLPEPLRADANVWNVPKDDFGDENLANPDHQCDYKHLRRVGVSSVRVLIPRNDQGEPVNRIAPKEVRSLASELDEWIIGDAIRDTADKGIVAPDRKWYLLTTQADDDIFKQPSVSLKLRKPATGFWNWYAWEGNEASDDDKKAAYKYDLLRRDRPFHESRVDEDLLINALYDSAVEHRLVLHVECLFPTKTSTYRSVPFPGDANARLEDPEITLAVRQDADVDHEVDVDVTHSNVVVTVPLGQVVRVSCHAVVRRADFAVNGGRFHDWMGFKEGNLGGLLELQADPTEGEETDFALTRPVELWFEAARVFPTKEDIQEDFRTLVWKSLTIGQNGDKVTASMRRTSEDYDVLGLIGRIDVHHQVWHWNGRLIDTGQLAAEARKNAKEKDPSKKLDPDPSADPPQTTEAMKWEAWAFSDRPDFSRMTKECHLRLWRPKSEVDEEHEEEIFADHRPKEEKALYYRFSATAWSRYAVLGGGFKDPVDTAVVVEDVPAEVLNPWRRFIRRASRSKPMPKPAIRFILPLTKSFNQANGHASPDDPAASLLIVLNDRWYTEAGLAEQLEVGVEVLKSPVDRGLWYANAGYDPTLTGEALPGFAHMPLVQARPAGPVGLTFDFAAQTPRLVGSAFILALPDEIPLGEQAPLRLKETLKAWFMMRVSVRRKLHPELCEAPLPPQDEGEENADDAPKPLPTLDSPWTAPEWVQFLPSVDFIIPKAWRDQAKCQGHVNLSMADGYINVPNGQRFDRTFEERMERWLVVTQRVYDIGGQPCESYVATLACRNGSVDGDQSELRFDVIDPREGNIRNLKDGYLRFILVRKRPGEPADKSPWSMLFGESVDSSPDLKGVEDDPSVASPIVSDRLSFRAD